MTTDTKTPDEKLNEAMSLIQRSRSILKLLAHEDANMDGSVAWDVADTTGEMLERAYQLADEVAFALLPRQADEPTPKADGGAA